MQVLEEDFEEEELLANLDDCIQIKYKIITINLPETKPIKIYLDDLYDLITLSSSKNSQVQEWTWAIFETVKRKI